MKWKRAVIKDIKLSHGQAKIRKDIKYVKLVNWEPVCFELELDFLR